MKMTRHFIVLIIVMSVWAGCNTGNGDMEQDITTEEGIINAEFFLQEDTVTMFWKIREIPGRSTLVIQQGVLGGTISSYELFGDDRTALTRTAVDLALDKSREGYRIYGPEAYSQIIIQIDTIYWGDVSDLNKLAFMEDVIGEGLSQSGNGKSAGSDISHKVSFYAVVFDVDIAVRTILKTLRDNNLGLPVVIAVEKAGDITVIYPENYHGDFSLI